MITLHSEQERPGWRFWLNWTLATIPGYAVGIAINGAMGEVVGEVLGGEVLHKVGHTVGMGLFGIIVVLAQWPILHRRIHWARRWAGAMILGYALGVAIYSPVLMLARGGIPFEIEIALTTFVPLGAAALAQWLALRRSIPYAGLWAAVYAFTFMMGWGLVWLLIGGVSGLAVHGYYPVVRSAIRFGLEQIPTGLAGGALFGATSGVSLIWLLRQQNLRVSPETPFVTVD